MIGGIVGHHEIVDGLFALVGQLADLLFQHRVRLHAVAGQTVMGIGLPQSLGKSPLLPGVLRQGGFHQIVVEQLLQDGIGQGVRGTVQLVPGDGSARHQRRTLGDIVDPGQQRLGLADSLRPDHVHELRRGLHHIGGNTAGIGNGIVDGALGLHMLPEELDADVHQLRAVQSGAAVPWVSRGVGGGAREFIDHLHTGGVGAGGHLVGVAGVPGNGGVQILEKAVSRHKGLARAAFLAGASIENNGSLQLSGSNGILDGDSRGKAGRAQQIVAAALPAAALNKRLLFRHAGNLRQTGQGIIFAQNADLGAAGAIASGESRGNTAKVLLYPEALLLQQRHIGRRGLGLQHGELGVLPDFVAEGQYLILLGLNGMIQFLLVHITAPSSESPGAGDGWDG